jgi:hypothetical protein
VFYRYTSAIAHASDTGAHVDFDSGDDEGVFQLHPTVDGFEAPTYAARELMWHMASRINDRLGLGFDPTLAPLKLTKGDIKSGLV